MSSRFRDYFFSTIKLFLVFVLSCLFFVGIYFFLQKTGLLGKFNNVQELKKIILSGGFWSYFIFALLQYLQVTILPLPASVTTLVGVILFGPIVAFLISLFSILLGSITAYLLGKTLGIKLLIWAVGETKTTQIQQLFQKGKIIFFLMMLFPFFPDDLLCMFAGVSNMHFKQFLYINLITRTIGIFCLCFLGNFTLFTFIF